MITTLSTIYVMENIRGVDINTEIRNADKTPFVTPQFCMLPRLRSIARSALLCRQRTVDALARFARNNLS